MTYDIVQIATFSNGEIKAKGSKGMQMTLKDCDIARFRKEYPEYTRTSIKQLTYKLRHKRVDFSSLNGVDPRTPEQFEKEERKKGRTMAKNEKYHIKLCGTGSKKEYQIEEAFLDIVDEYKKTSLKDFGKSINSLEDCKLDTEKSECTIIFKCEPRFMEHEMFDRHMIALKKKMVESGICKDTEESKRIA